MFVGPPADRASLGWRAYGWSVQEQRRYEFDKEQDMRFYVDQLYNLHAFSSSTVLDNVIPRTHMVWGTLTGRASRPARLFVASYNHGNAWWEYRCSWGRRRAVTLPAWHQVPVLVRGNGGRFDDTLRARNWWYRQIRVLQCQEWLVLVGLLVKKTDWGNDVVAKTVCDQLEAWFATVRHEDVRWANCLGFAGAKLRYRVCWWKE